MLKGHRFTVFLLGALVVGLLGKKYFFPSPEDQIKKRLHTFATLLSRSKSEGTILAANKIRQAVDFFQAPVDVTLIDEIGVTRPYNQQDKDRIKESISGIKMRHSWLEVKFENLQIVVRGDEADATFTTRLEFESSKQGHVYDLYPTQFTLGKTEGEWFIRALEVKLLEGRKDP